MEHTWGTPETQPPERPHQPERQPPRYEYAWLTLCVAAMTSALALFAIDHLSPFDFSRGGYSILTGVFVLGGCGWLVRSRETRLMAHNRRCAERISRELAALAGAVEELRAEAGKAHVTYLPKQHQPARYVGSAALADPGDTVPLMPTVAPETVAVLRRINMRLHNGGAEGG